MCDDRVEKCNKAGNTATLVACGWAGAVLEKVTGSFGQEPYAQNAQNQHQKSNSRKSVRWSAVLMPCLSRLRLKLRREQGSGPKGVDDLCFHTYGGLCMLDMEVRGAAAAKGPMPYAEAKI